jgi:hypothetical protein
MILHQADRVGRCDTLRWDGIGNLKGIREREEVED